MLRYVSRIFGMPRTTIGVDRKVRDRLKGFGTKDMDYDEILTRLMDEVEREEFVAAMRREIEETKDWIDLEDVE